MNREQQKMQFYVDSLSPEEKRARMEFMKKDSVFEARRMIKTSRICGVACDVYDFRRSFQDQDVMECYGKEK